MSDARVPDGMTVVDWSVDDQERAQALRDEADAWFAAREHRCQWDRVTGECVTESCDRINAAVRLAAKAAPGKAEQVASRAERVAYDAEVGRPSHSDDVNLERITLKDERPFCPNTFPHAPHRNAIFTDWNRSESFDCNGGE